ncbi:hypothetical protein FV296_23130 [Escherichia coli]|nr:hypothetical protein FV296_23130 [Escherichia coli]
MLPSETMIWQPEFTDKILSRKPGAVHTAYTLQHDAGEVRLQSGEGIKNSLLRYENRPRGERNIPG